MTDERNGHVRRTDCDVYAVAKHDSRRGKLDHSSFAMPGDVQISIDVATHAIESEVGKFLQQALAGKSLAWNAGRAHRQVQFASIKLFENVQRAARPKIQPHPGSNPGNMGRYRSDQNDRRVVIDRYAERCRRL